MGSDGGGTEHMQRISTVVLGLMLGAGLLATACVPPPTPPADSGRYVATTGTDTGTCKKSATPCRTINYAVSQAVAGETVRVAAGTYPELVTVDKGLTFLGANAGKRAGLSPAIRTAESVVKGFRSPGVPHPDASQSFSVTIDGFSIDPQGDAALLAPATQHLVSLFGGPQVIVRNNLLDGGSYVVGLRLRLHDHDRRRRDGAVGHLRGEGQLLHRLPLTGGRHAVRPGSPDRVRHDLRQLLHPLHEPGGVGP